MSKKLNINAESTEEYNYIYLENDEKLLKFKISVNGLNMINIIEKMIKNLGIYNFKVMSEKNVNLENEAGNLNVPTILLPYVGEFRLDNPLFKTKNYLIPSDSSQNKLLKFFTEKYNNNLFTRMDLETLCELKSEEISKNNMNNLEFINQLCLDMNVELVDVYDFNERVGNCVIDSLEKLVVNNDVRGILAKIRFMLYSCNINKECIEKLGLEQNFATAIKNYNEKEQQKVK